MPKKEAKRQDDQKVKLKWGNIRPERPLNREPWAYARPSCLKEAT